MPSFAVVSFVSPDKMRFFGLLLVAVGLCEARRALLSEAEEERLERRQTSETAGYPANFFDQNVSAVELH